MLVSCLLPTYNRFPKLSYLLEEAVECFLRQDYQQKELILLNDCPQQTLHCDTPGVRVINASERFPTLGDKLHWMIEHAEGDYICRWDDDDISLPWRLSYSIGQLFGITVRNTPGFTPFSPPKNRTPQTEWRPENHWYAPRGGELSETKHPGNTHIMSIWHKRLILEQSVRYPGQPCPSGVEDQTFTGHLRSLGYPFYGDLLPLHDIFYMYRWGTGSKHLSGAGGGERMQQSYRELADDCITPGDFTITPRWYTDHVASARAAADRLAGLRQPAATV